MAVIRVLPGLLAMQFLLTAVSANLPSVWEPMQILEYFCQRWYHQSVIKNDTLFIHGGIQTFQIPTSGDTNWTNATIGYNPFLLQVDLKESWDWKTNLSYIALEQNPNPRTGTSVRNGTVRGAMYHGPYSDPQIYTYAGTTFRGNESFPNSEVDYHQVQYSDQYPLWSFDNSTQTWNQWDVGQSWTPSYGASAEAPDQGLAFYLNGRTDNGSSSSTLWDADVQTLLDGMMMIDMVNHSSRNLSTTGMKDYQPRVGGAMQYAPGLGDNGILVTLGGQVFDGQRKTSSQDKGRLLNFETVDVFDIASSLGDSPGSGAWYAQQTSGDVPPPRVDFCTIIASAPDNSSHNIYLYAGRDHTGANGTVFYDDIYVLSLPSFTWINIYQGKSPRYGHTCHLVGGRQMITVGGHNRHQNKCDWEKKSVAVLDLPTLGWGSVFHAGYSQYELSSNLTTALGGSSTGGATLQSPAKGWASKDFEKVVTTKRIYSNYDGTIKLIKPKGGGGLDSNTRVAIIAGVSIAGTVLMACIIWLTILYRRRNKAGRIFARHGSMPHIEMEDKHRFELTPDEKKIYEVPGTQCLPEFPNTALVAEADRTHGVTYAVELPATNFSENGRWGVPIIRVPSPSMLKRENSSSTSSGSDTAVEDDSPNMPKKGAEDMV
ncbi:hypothetical protein BS50DRAFT_366427 [Corynespora cassiicola Philippines]|uniref:Galactose oxidase n=1 Tax=Corynespora cassiicola Philippines TaxID=1448308 RepID=A0A2T2NSX2_CORCC|nr:hypothetical protein BS50DRAFT_366427 [Corynespora cassiicola Philippines]